MWLAEVAVEEAQVEAELEVLREAEVLEELASLPLAPSRALTSQAKEPTRASQSTLLKHANMVQQTITNMLQALQRPPSTTRRLSLSQRM